MIKELKGHIKINNDFFLKGIFEGKYKTDPLKTRNYEELSKIVLLEANIIDAERCRYEEIILLDGDVLEFNEPIEMNISLKNEKSKGFKFKEDLDNIKISNVNLSDQIIEGHIVYGVIKGEILCSLPSVKDIQPQTFLPIQDTIILDENHKQKRKIFKFNFNREAFFSFLKLLGVLLLFYLIVLGLSKIDSEKVYNSLPNYKKNQTIPLTDLYGQKVVKVEIDNQITTFLLDTGASSTVISMSYLKKLMRSGYISRSKNFIEYRNFTIADGSNVYGEVWNIPLMILGDVELKNVEVAAIEGDNITFLLGMSTLNKLGEYKISPNENLIIID